MEPDKLVKKGKLSTLEAIKYNSYPCIKLDKLWQALHQFYSKA